ncbi:YlaH-like family protein [Mammaliicoccus sciuri]
MLLVAKNVSVNPTERLSFFGKLFRVDENPEPGMWLLLLTIFVLSAIVYNLGFARKLKFWQNIIIYILLFLGCLLLTFLAVFLPVGESLIIAAIVLGLYRYRLHKERSSGKQQ